jgi:putative AdoMet-dependent methyltransferase
MDYERALNLIVQWVSPLTGEKGLDIGTGTGNLAGKFIEQGVHMSGVDQSKEKLRQCKRKYPALETRLGNFLAIPYLEGEFDFIVSSFAFHHLNHEQQLLALEEMRRVLKPHGRICMADLMVISKHTRDHAINDRLQGSAASVPNDTEDYLILPQLLEWFESHGYATKHHQFNDFLHLIYAIPIQ